MPHGSTVGSVVGYLVVGDTLGVRLGAVLVMVGLELGDILAS